MCSDRDRIQALSRPLGAPPAPFCHLLLKVEFDFVNHSY